MSNNYSAQNNSMKSTNIIASFVSFVFAMYLISGITIRQFSHASDKDWAVKETSRLAMQIAYTGEITAAPREIDTKNSTQKISRKTASIDSSVNFVKKSAHTVWKDEGTLGKDPWGKPFRYKVFRDESGFARKIAVWSEGQNSRNETDFSEFLSLKDHSANMFLGDDAGFIRSVDGSDKL